ncbi:MAG: Hsp20/alpha crystallin family protein [Candidatus Taylorbacteria bacterium]|nr:Hsp20/alpha crystallin family protein [Candidatus Taylorbacteria bacterium]
MKEKRSFFERLTGSVHLDEDGGAKEKESLPRGKNQKGLSAARGEAQAGEKENWIEEENEDGQLTVDVYQTPDDIIIKTMVAGVKPEDLDISITRDMVTLKGSREESREVNDGDYFTKELYWGSFSRTILLPQEIEVEGAEASEKHGLLIIKLPKLDKGRQTKLKVRSS